MKKLFFVLLLLSFTTSLFGSFSFRDGFMKITIKLKGLVENLNITVLATFLSNVIVTKDSQKSLRNLNLFVKQIN